MLPAPALLAVGLVLGLLILLPARRLQLAGFGSTAIVTYAAILWALAFFLALWPVATRLLVPILVIAYLAPFVVAPARLSRIVRRVRGPDDGGDKPPRPPIKNVTPPDPPSGPS
ncbi:MAG: hypothetical protein ABI562_07790 [Chloroflexota bacterium]